MNENAMDELFRRQAAWQRSRAALSWPAKMRIAAAIRDSVVEFQRQRAAPPISSENAATPSQRGSRRKR